MPRISGKDCTLLFWTGSAFAIVADLYEWEARYEQVVLDASIKMDTAERQLPSHFRGRLTAKRWVQDVASALVLAQLAASNARVEFAVMAKSIRDSTGSDFTTTSSVRLQATGYVTSGQVLAPSESGVQDNFELVFDTIPAVFQ